jgi:hypothetical protein
VALRQSYRETILEACYRALSHIGESVVACG